MSSTITFSLVIHLLLFYFENKKKKVLAREFTTWPNDATVEMGDPVRFACEIESMPEAEITWEKDGVAVVTVTQTDNQQDGDNGTDSINGSPIHPRFVKLESGKILHIYNVQPENAGNYR